MAWLVELLLLLLLPYHAMITKKRNIVERRIHSDIASVDNKRAEGALSVVAGGGCGAAAAWNGNFGGKSVEEAVLGKFLASIEWR